MLTTDEQCRTFAKGFMDLVFERIKSGDDEHQSWLKDECFMLEKSLAALLATAAAEHPNG